MAEESIPFEIFLENNPFGTNEYSRKQTCSILIAKVGEKKQEKRINATLYNHITDENTLLLHLFKNTKTRHLTTNLLLFPEYRSSISSTRIPPPSLSPPHPFPHICTYVRMYAGILHFCNITFVHVHTHKSAICYEQSAPSPRSPPPFLTVSRSSSSSLHIGELSRKRAGSYLPILHLPKIIAFLLIPLYLLLLRASALRPPPPTSVATTCWWTLAQESRQRLCPIENAATHIHTHIAIVQTIIYIYIYILFICIYMCVYIIYVCI